MFRSAISHFHVSANRNAIDSVPNPNHDNSEVVDESATA